MFSLSHDPYRIADQIAQIDLGQIHQPPFLTRPTGLQDLLDGIEQTLVIGEHYIVKLQLFFPIKITGF